MDVKGDTMQKKKRKRGVPPKNPYQTFIQRKERDVMGIPHVVTGKMWLCPYLVKDVTQDTLPLCLNSALATGRFNLQ